MKSSFIAVCLLVFGPSAAIAQGTHTLEGQIVCCSDCWNRADRKTTPYGTPADLAKASECVSKGDPTLIAVMGSDGSSTFYQLEDGTYKKPGKNWLELIGSRVEIWGPLRSRKDKHFVRVNSLKVLATPDRIAPRANVIGTQTELILKDLFAVEQRLSLLRGRIVVLNFWATYCGPCLKEMPDLAAIQNQYAALGVQVVGAAADTLAQQREVRKFVTDLKINFPVWLGAAVEDMSRFGLGPALPGTAVIDREGRIVATYPGLVTLTDLRKQLDSLIATSQKQAQDQIASATRRSQEVSSVPS